MNCERKLAGGRRSCESLRACGTICSFVALFLIASTGCNKHKEGPKRADHKAAHTQQFHPDLRRDSSAAPGKATNATAQPPPASQPAAVSGPAPMGTPLLFINGETVTVPEILEPIYEELQENARKQSPQAYMSTMQRAIHRQIDMHVSTILIHQEAKNTFPEKANEFFDKEVERRLKEIVAERYGGVHARYEAHLKALELTTNDIKTRLKRQVMVAQYVRERFKPMVHEATRRQLHNYYQAHLEDFTTPERAELFLIEIPIDTILGKPRNTANSEELATAARKAVHQLQRAREELESGIDFAAVARAYSKGLKASQGGAFGEIGPGTLQGRWAKAAEILFTLNENEISEVIQMPDAVFLVKCGKRTPARQTSFEEAQEKIMDRMRDEQFSQLSQEHVAELLRKATVYPVQEFTLAVTMAAPRPPVLLFEKSDHNKIQDD